MKEYRVVQAKLGISRRHEKLQDLLNQYARERWVVNHIDSHSQYIVFERNKNI